MANFDWDIGKDKIDAFPAHPFLDGPGEYLCKTLASEIKKIPQMTKIFGEFIDPYKRMDYQLTNLPALRIYSDGFVKQFESWFIDGDLTMDIIWPASLRRVEHQQLQDTMAAAFVQMFRSRKFFCDLSEIIGEEDTPETTGFRTLGVPGLNQLGKRITVDKSLGFEITEEETVPLTQIEVNFRVDLRVWDKYLEENDRTLDDPFEQTLGNLEQLIGIVEAIGMDSTPPEKAETSTDQKIGD